MSKLAEELHKKIEALEKQRADIGEQLTIYQAALRNEQRNGAGVEAVAEAEIKEGSVKHRRKKKHRRSRRAMADTDFIRDVIAQSADTGIDAGGIKEAAKKKGLAMSEKYPYALLWKLKDRGEIVLDKGKYYAVPEPPN